MSVEGKGISTHHVPDSAVLVIPIGIGIGVWKVSRNPFLIDTVAELVPEEMIPVGPDKGSLREATYAR